MILTTQRLPPLKNSIKPNISSISTPKDIYFPNLDKLKKYKKKIAPISNVTKVDISNSDDIDLRINTSSSKKSENESKSPETTKRKRKIIFFPKSVDKKATKNNEKKNIYIFKIQRRQ